LSTRRKFDYYLRDVEKVSENPGTARALIEDAEGRLKFIKSVIEGVMIKDENAKYIFENNYDVIRVCAECLMIADGYHTKAPNSHEIAVAFVEDKYREFGDNLVEDFDRYRKMRNDSKYRANYVTGEVAKESFEIAEEYVRITRLIFNSKYH
jgi:hypothetical protein